MHPYYLMDCGGGITNVIVAETYQKAVKMVMEEHSEFSQSYIEEFLLSGEDFKEYLAWFKETIL